MFVEREPLLDLVLGESGGATVCRPCCGSEHIMHPGEAEKDLPQHFIRRHRGLVVGPLGYDLAALVASPQQTWPRREA